MKRLFLAFIVVFLVTDHTYNLHSPSPTAPSVSLDMPLTSFTGEVVLVDARQSSGVSNAPQANGTPSVEIDFGDGLTCNLLACSHAYLNAGTYLVTLTAKNTSGETATASRQIVVSDIPTGSTQTLTDSGNATTNATNLQNAINTAAANNVSSERVIGLPSGFVALGPIVLPATSGSRYITINWASGSFTSGRRVTTADRTGAPVIMAPSSTSLTHAAMWTVQPAATPVAHHYRLEGLHFKKDLEASPSQSLLTIGDVNPSLNTIAKLPHHFIVSHCWFNGGSSDTSQTTNGIRIAADYVSVVDSELGNDTDAFRLIGAGVDTAAISLSKGRGPFAFINNQMVASSENFSISGGSAEVNTATVSAPTTTSATLSSVTNLSVDQNIALKVNGAYSYAQTTIVRSVNTSTRAITFDPIPGAPDNGSVAEWIATPSFLEFRRNYLFKQLEWWPQSPSYNGLDTQVKNLWETKEGRYMVVDGNVMRYSWVAAQSYAITLTVRNQNGGESPANVVRQLQWSNNIVRDVANGVSVLPSDYFGPTQLTSDVTFRNNLFWNCGPGFDPQFGNMLINLLAGLAPTDRAKRIFLIHNTHDNPTIFGTISDFGAVNSGSGATDARWLNNVHGHGAYGFRSNVSNQNQAANIVQFLPDGSSSIWTKNFVLSPVTGNGVYPDNPGQFDSNPATGVYFAGNYASQFVNRTAGDFTLASSSPGKGVATDGGDIGVNMTTLTAATRHTIDGNWAASPTPTPTPASTFTVTGTDTVSGTALPGVSMRLLRASDRSLITSSDSLTNGTYSLTAGAGQSVIVSPSLAGYTFVPSEVLYSTINSNKTQNFAAVVIVAPTPTPTPLPSPSPSPSPTATPTPGICRPNELLSSGCTCLTKPVGPPNARRCKP